MEKLVVTYKSSVKVPAGWRSIIIKAEVERITAGMAKVVGVLEIDGEEACGTLSRTGARRQEFHGPTVARQELGTRKRLSACSLV